MEEKVKVYRSKVDIWLLVVLFVSLFSAPAVMLFQGQFEWGAVIIMGIVWVFVLWMLYDTKYIIKGEVLIIKCCFLRETYPIKTIKKIARTRSLLSAPAASLDRIQISGKRDAIISPVRRAEFLKDLLNVNPAIRLDGALRGEIS